MGYTVEEALAARRKKKQEQESADTNKSYTVEEALAARKKKITDSLPDTEKALRAEYDSIVEGYNTSLDAFNNGYGKKAFAEEMTTKRLATDKITGLKRKYEQYRSYFGDEYTDKYISALDDILAGYGERGQAAQIRSNYNTKGEYDTAVEQAQWYEKYSDMDAQTRADALDMLRSKLSTSSGVYGPVSPEAVVNTYGPLPAEQEAVRRELAFAEGLPAREAAQAEHERLMGIDTAAAQAEIEQAEKDGSLTSAQLAEKRKALQDAQAYQKVQEYNALMDRPDFELMSQPRQEYANSRSYAYIGDIEPDYGSGIKEWWNRWLFATMNYSAADLDTLGGGNINADMTYDEMTADEKATYIYIVNTVADETGDIFKGYEAGDEYIQTLSQTLEYRRSNDILKYTDNPYILGAVSGVRSGFDAFEAIIDPNAARTQSALQIAANEASSDLGFWGKLAYDAVYNTANQIPSQVTGLLVSLATGSGEAGGWTTSLMMGLGAAGNEYEANLQAGRSEEEATKAAIITGVSEVALEKIMGLIPGGSAVKKKILKGIKGALGRTAARYGIDVLGEVAEEGIQSVIEQTIKPKLAYGESIDGIDIEEVLYSSMVAAVSTGPIAGVSSVVATNNELRVLRDTGAMIREGGMQTELAEIASAFVAETKDGKLSSDQKYVSRLISKENMSDADIGSVYQTLAENGYGDTLAGITSSLYSGDTTSTSQTARDAEYKYEVAQTDTHTTATETSSQDTAEAARTRQIPVQMNESVAADVPEVTVTTPEGLSRTAVSFDTTADGSLGISTEDGNVIAVAEAEFDTPDSAIYEVIGGIDGITPAAANVLATGYDASEGLSATDYALGVKEAYTYGEMGMAKSALASTQFAGMLSERAINNAYEVGRMAGEATADARVKKNKASSTGAKKGGSVVYEKGVDSGKLSAVQKTAVNTMKALSEAFGINFHVYASRATESGRVYTDKDGKTVKAPNGWYEPSTGDIYIDLNAGNSGQGTMMFTLAHELTHFIKDWSPKKYRVLGNFLTEKLTENGQNVDELIENEIYSAKKRGRTISRNQAYDEVVAKAMEEMLVSEDAQLTLAELYEKDKTLWQKIMDFIGDFIDHIKEVLSAYEGKQSDSAVAKMVRELGDARTQLEQLYIDALADAGEMYSESGEGVSDGKRVFDEKNAQSKTSKGVSVPGTDRTLSQKFVDDTISSFGINKIGDYIHVQDRVFNTLLDEGFFADEETRSRTDINEETGMVIETNKSGIDETFCLENYGRTGRFNKLIKLATIRELPNAIKYGRLIEDDVKNEHGKNRKTKYAYFEYDTQIDGIDITIKLTIRKSMQKNKFYVHSFQTIKNASGSPADTDSGVKTGLTTTDSTTIPQNDDGVKREFSDRTSDVDAEYMSAVESGDMETAQRLVDEAAERAMPNSAIRDQNGKLMPLYHGTDANFYIFDTGVSGGSHGTAEGFGIYLSDSTEVTGSYGDRQIKMYANIKKPASSEKKTISLNKLIALIKDTCEREAQKMVDDGEYDSIKDAIRDTWISNYVYTYDISIDQAYRETAAEFMRANSSDMAIIQEVMFGEAIRSYDKAMEFYRNSLIPVTGFDGFVTKWENTRYEQTSKIYLAFDSAQLKSADPVTYDDSGKVIPLSERFNPERSDIRYSDREDESVYDILGETDRVEAENAKLRSDVERLRELVKLQRTLTHGQLFTKTSLNTAAKELMEKAGVKRGKEEIIPQIEEFFRYIARGEDLVYEEIMDRATAVAADVVSRVDNKAKPDARFKEIADGIRGVAVSLTSTQAQEVASSYGSVNSFRKSNFGKIRLTNDGTPLDVQWQEWSRTYPELFDADTPEGDMPARLAEIADAVRETTEIYNEYEMTELTREVASLLYDQYWRATTRQTFADKKQRQINELKAKHYREMSDLRQSRDDKVRATAQYYRDMVARVRENKDAKIERMKAAYAESRENARERHEKSVMRSKIKNTVASLDKLLRSPTKEKHVPISLQSSVAALLDAINMDTVDADPRVKKYEQFIAEERAKPSPDAEKIASYEASIERIRTAAGKLGEKLKKMKEAYAEIKNSVDPEISGAYHPEIAERLENLAELVGDTPLAAMSLEQMDYVYESVKMVESLVRNANKGFKVARQQTITELGEAVVSEESERPVREDKGGKVRQFMTRYGWNNLKPSYAFDVIGSRTLRMLFDNMRAGEDVYAVDISDARAFFREKAKKYGYDSWDLSQEFEVEVADGRKIMLTLNEIMSLYAYSKRAQAEGHLEIGGFVRDDSIEVVKKNKLGIPTKRNVNTANANPLSKNQTAKIVAMLSEDQIAFVDEMQDYLSTVMGAKGNEVSRQLYGIDLFREKVYFPLHSAEQFLFTENKPVGETSLRNWGAAKEILPGANNPIILSGFMDVWSKHVNQMSTYHAFVLPIEDFTRVYNYKGDVNVPGGQMGVKTAIQNAHTSAATNYVAQLLRDINGGVKADPIAGDWIGAGISRFKKAAVFASASVVIQQPSAMVRAMMYIDPKYFAKAKKFKNNTKYWNECKKYNPVAIVKEMGGIDTGTGAKATEWITSQEYEGIKAKAKGVLTDEAYRDDVLSAAPAAADRWAWTLIWNAAKEQIAETTDFERGSPEFYQAAHELFTKAIVETQVYDSVFTRSAAMRSKDSGMKMLTSFMAEPTTSVNMYAMAAIHAARGNKKLAAKMASAAAVSIIVNNVLVSLVYAARDDDEDQTYIEKYLEALATGSWDVINIFSMLPVFRDLISLWEGYDVERSDMSAYADLIDAFRNIGNGNKPVWQRIVDVAASIGNVTGVPLKNIYRDCRAIYNVMTGITDDEYVTWKGVKNSLIGAVPFKDSLSNAEQLYVAIKDGDTEHYNRVASRFKDENAVNNALKKAIAEADPAVSDSASKYIGGDVGAYAAMIDELVEEGFDEGVAADAVNYVVSKVKSAARDKLDGDTKAYNKAVDYLVSIGYDEEQLMRDIESVDASTSTGGSDAMFKKADYISAYTSGDEETLSRIEDDLIEAWQADGKSEDDIESSIRTYRKAAIKEGYLAGAYDDKKATKLLIRDGIIEEDPKDKDAAEHEAYWLFHEWKDKALHDGESGYEYHKYGEFYTAVETGENLKKVIRYYNSHGDDKSTLSKAITTHFKPLFKAAPNKTEQARIQARCLTAYEALGYKRSEKKDDIKEWLKE